MAWSAQGCQVFETVILSFPPRSLVVNDQIARGTTPRTAPTITVEGFKPALAPCLAPTATPRVEGVLGVLLAMPSVQAEHRTEARRLQPLAGDLKLVTAPLAHLEESAAGVARTLLGAKPAGVVFESGRMDAKRLPAILTYTSRLMGAGIVPFARLATELLRAAPSIGFALKWFSAVKAWLDRQSAVSVRAYSRAISCTLRPKWFDGKSLVAVEA